MCVCMYILKINKMYGSINTRKKRRDFMSKSIHVNNNNNNIKKKLTTHTFKTYNFKTSVK